MIEVGALDFFTDSRVIVNDELAGANLLQFTGLHDKNGREIFEGDIIRGRTEYSNDDGSTAFEEIETGKVVWLEREARFACRVSDFYNNPSAVEIIGNIYENPELEIFI